MKIIRKIVSKIEQYIIDIVTSGKIVFMSGGSSGRKNKIKK